MEDLTKNIIFTTNAIGGNAQPTTIQYQTADGTILIQPQSEGQTFELPTFYYTTTNTCYIAQPVGGYNYALVNGMQLNQGGTIGIATLDAQGRLQIVNQNKPLAATISPLQNTISNISFKCDVCGLMFPHLALLNHHKRIHAQDGSDPQQQQQQQQQQQADAISVVNAQGLVQTQNIITENGQMGQIQIVATEALEPATTVLQEQSTAAGNNANEVSSGGGGVVKSHKMDHSKCNSCGARLPQPAKRKGPKTMRCDAYIQAEQQQQQQATQIFVVSDDEFEMNELPSGQSDSSMDSLTAQGMLPNQLQPVQIISTTPQAQAQLQQLVAQQTGVTQATPASTIIKRGSCPSLTAGGHHPVKKNNSQQVTKSQKCNRSGVVYVGVDRSGGSASCINAGGKHHAVNAKSENPKPYKCNICGGIFSRYTSLWSHKKLHSGEKNYKCSICGLAFAKGYYLKKHVRIHTGEKPYKCQTCGILFSQWTYLKNHERTHTGERPYVCEVCDKAFARHATLWNHRRKHNVV